MMGTKRICEFDTNTDSLRGVQNMMSTKLQHQYLYPASIV